jgi:hypothetical protein
VKMLAVVALLIAFVQDPASEIGRLRASWARQDAPGIVTGATRVVIQLPGEPATAPLPSDQAARALAGLFVDATEVGLDVDTVRTLGHEAVYAEMRRRFRVRGSEGTVEQRVFAAFRLDGGRWRLQELRVGSAGR